MTGAATFRNEESDNYRAVVTVLDARWRIIESHDRIQWVLQRLAGTRWRGERYHRTLPGLKSSVAALCPDQTAIAALVAARLPERGPS